MTPTEVVIDARGTKRRIPVNEIKRVAYAEDPQELKRARSHILTGQAASGLADLKRIDPASISRKEVRDDLQFYLAFSQGQLALTGGGDKNAAVAAMLNFVRANPNSFHFFEAAELLGDLAVALESYDNAIKYYNAVAAKAPWPAYKMRATIREARALFAQQEYDTAQAKYEDVIAFDIDTAEAMRQKRLAEVGRAVSIAESGQHTEARKLLEEIVAKNDPQDMELFGRAYNGLGRCFLKADQSQDALLAYLHTDILFYGDPDVHAESLYHLSKLWNTVKKTDRAVSAKSLLKGRYSGSKWAKLQ
jgi:tetratricopeptide (TPR) repeat protein